LSISGAKLNINSEVGKWDAESIGHRAESDDAFAEKGIGIWGIGKGRRGSRGEMHRAEDMRKKGRRG
jgi:hypothetical protein